MAIDFGKGLKRIYIVLAGLYVIFMSVVGLALQNSVVKNYEEVLIGNVSCEKLREVFSNREDIQKQEEANVDSLELTRLSIFLDKYNLWNENPELVDRSNGCHGIVNFDLSFKDKYGSIIFFGGVLGLAPAIIIYFLLSFIINGFRKEK